MKVLSAPPIADIPLPPVANHFELPQGLIGFKDYTRAELLYMPDHLPFLWLKLHRGSEAVHFIVIEPGGLVPGYAPELFDADAEALDLKDASEAMLLNIVTLQHQNPLEAKVNLVGPIVMNRRTRIARQLVIANYSHYSAHWPLVEPSTQTRATA
ncbi:flagellar assembly protein FliW [Oleiharenicola lentus]|jgi:flagellar assembly factor FliW|uniref:Flagellar assembly factor FliW n=1 Tax=Oleiharenicola lentus TaxID=2508720 RepID=A0A4Q1C3G2_9BACT|nr:flagellar assembly protein FliW [Oleiharenicola lentus]RXK52938.1 flagellar assembly protein FliW [Oleiharenicola lentus]